VPFSVARLSVYHRRAVGVLIQLAVHHAQANGELDGERGHGGLSGAGRRSDLLGHEGFPREGATVGEEGREAAETPAVLVVEEELSAYITQSPEPSR